MKEKMQTRSKRGIGFTTLAASVSAAIGYAGGKIMEKLSQNEQLTELVENQISVMRIATDEIKEIRNAESFENIEKENLLWNALYVLSTMDRFSAMQRVILNMLSNDGKLQVELLKLIDLEEQVDSIQ